MIQHFLHTHLIISIRSMFRVLGIYKFGIHAVIDVKKIHRAFLIYTFQGELWISDDSSLPLLLFQRLTFISLGYFKLTFFCNRCNSFLNFGGPQLYDSEALPFTYDQNISIELADKLYNSITVCFSMNFHPDKQLFQVDSAGVRTNDPWITKPLHHGGPTYTVNLNWVEIIVWILI